VPRRMSVASRMIRSYKLDPLGMKTCFPSNKEKNLEGYALELHSGRVRLSSLAAKAPVV
jgi:hypothetical protein